MKFCDGNRIPSICAALTLLFAGAAASQIDREEALRSFVLHPDFQIELVAAEPVIYDPVDLDFDERGRPFVIEMPGYPFPEVPGRVILLEDADGDGFYETRKVFAEGFPVAASILAYNGGILVASPPDLIFLKDTDGDDVADVREVLLSGFTVDNPQHNFNGLNHGLDNWIYGANGGNSGTVYFSGDESNKVALRFNDFRVDLRQRRFERIGRSTGGFEITFDEYGRLFGTHNLRAISHLVFPGRYIEGFSGLPSGALALINDDDENGLIRIYPIGPQETRVNHPEQAGYFSASCGITYYGGGAFPESFNGNIFIADVVLNLVHRRVLAQDGASFVASRGRDRVEFLASTDRGFRPVNMTVAPDGSLWLLDMRRTIIEHPQWIPDELEREMDLDAGKELGRIYRITPIRGLPKVTPNFAREDLQAVVDALGHPNKWWRDTAQRLLVEWGDAAAIPFLTRLASTSDNPVARMHAMWTLKGLGALDRGALMRALGDEHAGVRENALVAAEGLLDSDSEIASRVTALAEDPDPRVRMQVALAFSAGRRALDDATRDAILSIATRDGDDPWTRLALLPSFAKDPVAFGRAWMTIERIAPESRAELLEILARLSGERSSQGEFMALMSLFVERAHLDAPLVATALEHLAAGLRTRAARVPAIRASSDIVDLIFDLLRTPSLDVVHGAWSVANALDLPQSVWQRSVLETARRIVLDEAEPVARRLEHLRLLEFQRFARRSEALYDLLGAAHPHELQVEAMGQLEREGDPATAQRLIAMWRGLGPNVRVKAGNFLLYRRGNHDLLLTALESDAIALGELNLHLERRRVLLRSRDDDIRRRAEALFSDAGVVTRREALERMRPALDLAGDVSRGEAVFTELCVKCHRMGAEGGDLGPNLGDIYRKSGETLLHDILDPNAAVDREYVSYTIDLPDGEVLSGIVIHETDSEVTIRDATGEQTTVARDEMTGMYSDGLSLMPEELEVDMKLETMADLLAYLQQPK